MPLPTKIDYGSSAIDFLADEAARTWAPNELSDLRGHFPCARFDDLEALIGRSGIAISNKAAELGLRQTSGHVACNNFDFAKKVGPHGFEEFWCLEVRGFQCRYGPNERYCGGF